jgi:DNA-binding protein
MSKPNLKNTVIVGKKPAMNYVMACVTLFNEGTKIVNIKARGQAISNAIDTVQLLRRAFVEDLEIRNIKIDTDELRRDGGYKTHVSTIDIFISKPD